MMSVCSRAIIFNNKRTEQSLLIFYAIKHLLCENLVRACRELVHRFKGRYRAKQVLLLSSHTTYSADLIASRDIVAVM